MKLKKHQEELLNSRKEIILCDWRRQSGFTTAILEKILKEGINAAFVGVVNSFNTRQMIFEELKKHDRYLLDFLVVTNKEKDLVEIIHAHKEKSVIRIYGNGSDRYRGTKTDLIILESAVYKRYDLNQILDMKRDMMAKQLIITTGTKLDIEFIDDSIE